MPLSRGRPHHHVGGGLAVTNLIAVPSEMITILTVSNESIRRCVLKFGPIIARNLRENRPKPYTRWHLDEMVVSIAGRQMYMWRAVDSEGEVLEILVQPQGRGIAAAPQTPSSPGFRSDSYRHRQAEILWGGPSRNWLLGLARARTARQQPRRTRIRRFDDANERCMWTAACTERNLCADPTLPDRGRSRHQSASPSGRALLQDRKPAEPRTER
jgi:hypothetical protein